MSKIQLVRAARVRTNAMAKLGKNKDRQIDVLVKIYDVPNCALDDIMDIFPNPSIGVTDNDERYKHQKAGGRPVGIR